MVFGGAASKAEQLISAVRDMLEETGLPFIIENVQGESSETKAVIDADYRKGIVRYKDIRVGEYKDGKMELKGDAQQFKGHLDKLME